ncbi:TonB-dependent receptor [Exilibacterium tricleocarpae]|uniref:TonB-dependent receptor n=1 Tax=Exilibacterium tricleocarpae TaxID=2591008 RepID=A0A545TZM3_9GAMM|nr:TonB-dependent receptor [Exilibacterium tricleocarpae]TQV82668.1 TonB-dependent receptor [Exilibacterium tricleocarpae]
MRTIDLKRLAKGVACANLGLVAALTAVTPSYAIEIEEIVVTARKRPESLQEVPIAVTAITERQIERAGMERPADFIGTMPNVTIVDSANVGDTQVSIRGIVSTRDAESTFAYVVDGVLITNPNGFNEELLDVAQIEVLKGPQGALYGRNAVSGAILVTTKAPADEFEGKVKVGFGNNNTQTATGVISGPLTDALKGRLSFSHRSTDGHYTNVFTGADDEVDFLEDNTFRGRLLWDVNDDLTLDLRAGYSEVEGGAINFNAVFGLPSFVAAFDQPAYFADVNDHDFTFAFNVPGGNEQETTELSLKADWTLGDIDVTAVLAYNNLEEFLLSDGTSASFYGYEVTDQCLADRTTLNNAPAALGGSDRTDLFGDFFAPFGVLPPSPDTNFVGVYGPYTPTACDGYQYQERNQEDFSGELRFTSDQTASLRWIAGLYFAEIERDVVVAYGADTGRGFLRQPYVDPTGPNPTDLLFDDTFETSVIAGFGQLEFDLSDTVELALALRYDREERDVSNNVPNVRASGLNVNTIVEGEVGPINPAFSLNPDGIPDRSDTFTQLQPKISLAWSATDNVNIYGSYGVGFRSGGFNSIGTQATLDFWFNASGDGNPGDAVDAQLRVTDEYDKEVTTSFELGAKGQFMDQRLRINAAVFQTEVEDNQFFEFFAGPFGLLRAVTTIDELEIRGFEMDFNIVATEYLSLFGGFGILDSEIVENRNRPASEGNNAPQAPKETYNLGAVVEIPVSDGIDFVARVDWQHVGDMWFHTLQGEATPTIWDFFGTLGGGVPPGPHSQDFSRAKRDAYQTVNARFGLEGEAWTLSVWGRNITDEEYLEEVIPAPEFGGSFIHPSARDAYGIDFSYRF